MGAAASVLICLIAVLGSYVPSYADVATDTLAIKVGYGGMQLSEFVDVDQYHWRDLRDNLELHQEAYSYFQSTSKTKYSAIVDSAQGFYIADILNLAGIYYGDVRSLKFYVEDHKGIRTSFDKSALFDSRYYYDDVSGNRTVVYGTKTVTEEEIEIVHHDAVYETETYIDEETGEEKTREVLVEEAWDEEVPHTVEKEVADKSKIIEYTFEHASDHASQVQPMLAIEDNWAQFNEDFEHCGPDFSSMNAGNRFRLLFGQTSPTESLTSKSDKYVSCVYVVLEGSPKIDDMGELDGEIGSHTVDMTVSADNEAVRNALSKLMNINSTNTNVLVITGIKVTPDDRYSDLAKVTVAYDIVGKGEAAITAGVGTDSEPLATSKVVQGGVAPDEGQAGNGEQNGGKDKQSPSSEDEKKQNEEEGKNSKTGGSGKTSDSKSKGTAGSEKKESSEVREKKSDEINKKNEDNTNELNNIHTYLLSDAAVKNLQNSIMNQTEVAVAPEDKIQEVKIEDHSKEKEQRHRQLLLFTGLGCLALGASGSVSELVSFRVRLKGVRE